LVIEGVNATLNWQQTVKVEGRKPDAVYNIHLPDSVAPKVESAAQGERNLPEWNWAPTTDKQTNCTIAAMRVLFKGNVPALSIGAMPPFTPNNFNDAMGNLLKKPNSNVTLLPAVPWGE
jgi:hypothetical protein